MQADETWVMTVTPFPQRSAAGSGRHCTCTYPDLELLLMGLLHLTRAVKADTVNDSILDSKLLLHIPDLRFV